MLLEHIQVMPFEMNVRKKKWLFVSIYKPPLQSNNYFLDILNDLLEFYSSIYNNEVVFGGINLKPSNPGMMIFMDSKNFINPVKNNKCFEGVSFCIDLILINRKYSFKIMSSYETGISDHHHFDYFRLWKLHLHQKNLKSSFIATIKVFLMKVSKMTQCPKLLTKISTIPNWRKNL